MVRSPIEVNHGQNSSETRAMQSARSGTAQLVVYFVALLIALQKKMCSTVAVHRFGTI